MKKTIALASIIAILFSVFAFVGTNVYAFEDATLATGNTGKVTITREVENVTNNVTNTFTYTITAKSGNPATVRDLPGTLTIDFNNVIPDANNVATKTADLDFTNVKFNELGDYYFTIAETGSTDSTTYPVDNTKTYDVVVSVRNTFEEDGVTPTGTYLVYAVATQGYNSNSETEEKENVLFESASQHTYIELTKKVEGNLGRLDEYFTYTISISNAKPNETYVISGSSAGANNPTEVTMDASGNGTVTLKLKHNDTITIGKDGTENQLPIRTTYTIVETDNNYQTFIDGSTENNKSMSQKTTVAVPGVDDDKTAFNTNNKTTYVNKREAGPVTGIFINVMPFVVLIALAFVGIMVIKKTSKKED